MSKMTKTVAVLGVVAGLGVAALPLGAYAATDTENITAQFEVGDAISITSSATDNTVKVANVMAGTDVASADTTLTIESNAAGGYQVTITDADDDTAAKPLGSGTASGIPAGVPTKGTSAWGYKVAAADGSTNVTVPAAAQNYRAVGENGSTAAIANGAAATATGGDQITLTFGVTVDHSIAKDTYADEVVLTATTK